MSPGKEMPVNDEEIQEKMRNSSVEELIEYVQGGTDAYIPQAVAAAKEELNRRGLSTEQIVQAEQNLLAQKKEDLEEKQIIADMPLARKWRVIIFLLAAPLIIPAFIRFSITGEKRKIKDIFIFGMAGLIVQYVVFCLFR